MADLGAELLLAASTFGASRLTQAADGAYKTPADLLASLFQTTPPEFEAKRADLEQKVRDQVPEVKDLVDKVDKLLPKIKHLAQLAQAELTAPAFDDANASRVAGRVAMVLMMVEEAVRPVADWISRDAAGTVRTAVSDQLVKAWSPWTKLFEKVGAQASAVLDPAAALVGIDDASTKLAERTTWDAADRRLSAEVVGVGEKKLGPVTFAKSSVEAFLTFTEKVVPSPTEEEQATLVKVGDTWFDVNQAILGVRVRTTVKPGLLADPLLKNLVKAEDEPESTTPTTVTLDTEDGLHLGEHGAKQEKALLPVSLRRPGLELREVTVALDRRDADEISGFELYLTLAGKFGDAVAFQVVGAGAVITFTGSASAAAAFDFPVAPRRPDKVGLRVKTDAVKGGGYLEKVTRTYDGVERVEYGGVVQLEILKAGVYAIGLLSPDPFSLMLVMGVRFPKAIELSFGFTLNGVGGIIGIERTVVTDKLVEGVQSGFLTQLLFPEDPVAEAPTILSRVAAVFPPRPGGLVVGPIIELGWGSEARIIEARLGVVLVLPDPKVLVLGSVRVRAPSKVTPLTDLKAEVVGEITGDRFLLVASLRDSTIAGIRVSGDLGLLIQWGGGGAFALSVGGFNPRHRDAPPALGGLERLTMDLSPSKGGPVSIIVKVYLAVTAGAVMAGVRGDLKAKLGPASAHAWVQLDMIFFWVPRFGFAVDLELGLSVEVWGHSFARVRFRGCLEGTTPWKIQGDGEIDVWFLPTIPLDLGPYTWGDPAPATAQAQSPLSVASSALRQDAAWSVVPPADADLLAVLSTAGVGAGVDLLAHPLGVLEVKQSRIPLETHLDRIGSSAVTAHRVHLGLPTTSAGPAGAVSTVVAPFAPGQFLELAGEALLARSGFEDLPAGCRIGAAATTVHGTARTGTVRWRTWIRPDPDSSDEQDFDPRLYTAAMVRLTLVGRHLEEEGNPYLTRGTVAATRPLVAVDPPGSATVRLADDGDRVVADLGILTLSEAARVADTITTAGAAHAVAVSLGAL